jgi:hypothetical protein
MAACDQVGRGHWTPTQQPEAVLLPKGPEASAGLQQLPQLTRGRGVDVRRGHIEQVAKEFAETPQNGAELRVHSGVLLGEGADSLGGASSVGSKNECVSVLPERQESRVRPDERHGPAQRHVPRDRGPQRSDSVREWRLEAGGERLVRHAPAGQLAALEDERSETGPDQVERRDQAVVPAPDDDDVRAAGHFLPSLMMR